MERLNRSALSLLLTALFLLQMLALAGLQPTAELPKVEVPEETEARQVEAECEGLTFEDMFNYTHATFDVQIRDDWQHADVRAVAWINGSLADDVRVDFDSLFEPLGTDNGWLSSDEYSAVRAIAADCVEQTNPRVGWRSGPEHRGGPGVNWYNGTWLNTDEEPMVLEEWNLMPTRHAQERQCQGGMSTDCVEIPAAPNADRDCDTDIAASAGVDECRMIVWLNATLQFNGLFNQDQFTVAMNTSNMTNSHLVVTYPAKEGLRMSMFEECDGRLIDQANNDHQGEAPTPGGCESDNSIHTETRLASIDGETRLQVMNHITYMHETWPIGQDMFMDMTTEAPESDDAPVWSEWAPADGHIFPIADDGQVSFLSADATNAWATDDHDNPAITCTLGDDWGLVSDAAGYSATVPAGADSTTLSCHATDSAGQMSDARTFTVQVPARITGETVASSADFTVTTTAGLPDMDMTITLVQDDAQTDMSFTMGADGQEVKSVSLETVSAGPFLVRVTASGEGMANFDHTYDLGLSKSSSPPSISVSSSAWNGDESDIQGTFSDPDGDSVTVTATLDGNTWGTVQQAGNMWLLVAPAVPNVAAHIVTVTACDEWGECTAIEHDAGAPAGWIQEEPPQVDPPSKSDDDGGGLPGFGVLLGIAALGLAARGHRRD